jgi:acyl-CoA hydrolase
MEVGVRVEAENFMTGEIRHTASAYLSFVALDAAGKPTPVPPLILETEEEGRRNREARNRREARFRENKV